MAGQIGGPVGPATVRPICAALLNPASVRSKSSTL
jgi:hypothetical protein